MSKRKSSPFKRNVLDYIANIVCYSHLGKKKKLLFSLVFCFVLGSIFFETIWVNRYTDNEWLSMYAFICKFYYHKDPLLRVKAEFRYSPGEMQIPTDPLSA